MEWILNEEGNIERLTEEKLGVYNEVLSGQVQGLEARRRDLIFLPRYRPVVSMVQGLARPIPGLERARELDDHLEKIRRSIHRMEAAQTADDVRAAIWEMGGQTPNSL